ncbi:hypothetical protein QBC37DRAFT_432892 [Rhypophila decipiens]|uniref:Uncharacterized protein n=1 Tax=Rhypophila decipiens TaxID=261697 RepID=A0AAN6XVR8_9PEZI|nr:hypothetical protein QBC37DRAFT_432892 [Rhypophila decipiens]
MCAALYNPISPQCTWGPCINQVAGYLDNNAVAQLSACQSVFGIPVVQTVTLPADDVFWTRTSTHTDVVIVVTTSTAYSTAEDISTAYETAYSTTTQYTMTVTSTVSTTATAGAAAQAKKNRRRRRAACKPKPSHALTTSLEPVASSTTTTPDPTPIPSNCPNLADYSSACACIEPRTVTTQPADSAATSIIDETVTVSAASTVETIITVAVTTVVVKPATTTLTSTIQTQTVTTTTTTSTVTPIPTIFNLQLIDLDDLSRHDGEYLTIQGSGQGMALQVFSSTPSSAGLLSLTAGASTPSIRGSPDFVMWAWVEPGQTRPIGKVVFQNNYYAGVISGEWRKVTCQFDTVSLPGHLYFNCQAPGSLGRFFRCDSEIFLTNNATPRPGCVPLLLGAVGV